MQYACVDACVCSVRYWEGCKGAEGNDFRLTAALCLSHYADLRGHRACLFDLGFSLAELVALEAADHRQKQDRTSQLEGFGARHVLVFRDVLGLLQEWSGSAHATQHVARAEPVPVPMAVLTASAGSSVHDHCCFLMMMLCADEIGRRNNVR